MKYILSEDARIYHFHTAADYLAAVKKYPAFSYGCYSKDYRFYHSDQPDATIYEHLKVQHKKYFLTPLEKLKEKMLSSGFTQSFIDSIKPKESGPYIFHSVENKIKKNIASFTTVFDYADIDNYRIKKQHKLEKAYAQLKYHCDNLSDIIQKYYADILEKVDPVEINYDAMRADGWNGFYVHTEAVEEAKIISKNSGRDTEEGYYQRRVYDTLAWWEVDSMCIWDWCFE